MARWFNYFIPGILDPVNNPKTWDYQAQAWLYSRGFGLSAGFNYSDGVFGGVLARPEQSEQVAADLLKAKDAGMLVRTIHHSNGNNIAAMALLNNPDLIVDDSHWIAAAMDRDCSANGLNTIAGRGQIKHAKIYVSSADEVLGLPLLSYGAFGKLGPDGVGPFLVRVMSQVNRTCGHCDWVGRDFEDTMAEIVRGVIADQPLL